MPSKEKKHITRREMNQSLRKQARTNPRFGSDQAKKIDKEILNRGKYGSNIRPRETRIAIRSLKRDLARTNNLKEKSEIRAKIKAIEKLF